MADEIKLYESELSSAIHMLRGCGEAVESVNAPAVPTLSSVSCAMTAFLSEVFTIEATVNEYLQVLKNDLAALEAAQEMLAEADRASASLMEG